MWRHCLAYLWYSTFPTVQDKQSLDLVVQHAVVSSAQSIDGTGSPLGVTRLLLSRKTGRCKYQPLSCSSKNDDLYYRLVNGIAG